MGQEAAGTYEPVEYNWKLQAALGCVALFYVLSQVFAAKLYYVLKASWARVALNL